MNDPLGPIEGKVLALGAADAGYREDDFRVCPDPAGHPFCPADGGFETP